ncbi:MAG: sugar phosphate isomerase/epimerase [Clostridia bacterium]|nr:sugar phosphate isomerase/epimerase [Clostridia bacterium]
MKAGISTAALYMRQNNEEAIETVSSLGPDCIEVFLTSFMEYKPEFASLLASKKHVEIHSIHVLTNQIEPQLFNPHERVRMDSFYFLEQLMQSAQRMGAKYYTFHGLTRAKKAAISGKNDDFDRLGSVEKDIFDFCEKYGVTLCQENVEWSTYNRVGVFKELKKRCPNLKGVLDLKQARLSGYDWRDYLSEMGEEIAHVHISDVDENGKMCLPGKGSFPFSELIARLRDVGFDGPLLIEPYERDFKEIEELKESLEFIRSLF